MKKTNMTIIAVLLVFLGFGEAFAQNGEIELRVGIREPFNAKNLDPATNISSEYNVLLGNIFSGLVGTNHYGELIPSLAKSWKISKDQLSYTFKLRDNVQCHDNSVLKASDVKASFERAIKKGTYVSYYLQYVDGTKELAAGESQNLSGVSVISDSELQIKLTKQFDQFINYLSATGLGIVKESKNGSIVGCGDYKYETLDDKRMLLSYNLPDKDQNVPQKITVNFYKNAKESVEAFLAGKIDYIYNLYPNGIKKLEENGKKVESFHSYSTFFLFLNTESEVFVDESYRKWLACEFRKKRPLQRKFLIPMIDYLPKGIYGHNKDQSISCSLEKPKSLAKTVKILVPEEVYDSEEIKLLKDIMLSVGVAVSVDLDSFGGTYYSKMKEGTYDGIYVRTSNAINDPDFYYLFFKEGSVLNVSKQKDKQVAAGIQRIRIESDFSKKIQLYKELNAHLLNRAYVLPLWQFKFNFSLSDRFETSDQAYQYYSLFKRIKAK